MRFLITGNKKVKVFFKAVIFSVISSGSAMLVIQTNILLPRQAKERSGYNFIIDILSIGREPQKFRLRQLLGGY